MPLPATPSITRTRLPVCGFCFLQGGRGMVGPWLPRATNRLLCNTRYRHLSPCGAWDGWCGWGPEGCCWRGYWAVARSLQASLPWGGCCGVVVRWCGGAGCRLFRMGVCAGMAAPGGGCHWLSAQRSSLWCVYRCVGMGKPPCGWRGRAPMGAGGKAGCGNAANLCAGGIGGVRYIQRPLIPVLREIGFDLHRFA